MNIISANEWQEQYHVDALDVSLCKVDGQQGLEQTPTYCNCYTSRWYFELASN